jgi:exopolyphosphatase/guanosine-5'-triphosphate,3'-diphosphate pyrophosphatase
MNPTSPKPRLAVIDLGTNTFHLLIAEPHEEGRFAEVVRDRAFVKLAENGIQRIGEAPFARGLSTLHRFADHLHNHQASRVRALGTAALRTAENGPEFIQTVLTETGIQIELIDGREEARLIHQGVSLALGGQANGRYLVMDIGGGSVEFIIADERQVYWAESFPVGVAVLYRNFHHSDPLSVQEREQLRLFLRSMLAPLAIALARYPVSSLVGAAGTFDVIEALLSTARLTPHASRIDLNRYHAFSLEISSAKLAQRAAMPGIPADRVDMIAVALVLVDVVLEMARIETLDVSAFSLKEGVLSELLSAV